MTEKRDKTNKYTEILMSEIRLGVRDKKTKQQKQMGIVIDMMTALADFGINKIT